MSESYRDTECQIHTEVSELGLLAITARIRKGDYTALMWSELIERLSGDIDTVQDQLLEILKEKTAGAGNIIQGPDVIHIGPVGTVLARSIRIEPQRFSMVIVDELFSGEHLDNK